MAARQPDQKSRLAIAHFKLPSHMLSTMKCEIGKRNGDGGAPQFIGASITDLVRALLETHP